MKGMVSLGLIQTNEQKVAGEVMETLWENHPWPLVHHSRLQRKSIAMPVPCRGLRVWKLIPGFENLNAASEVWGNNKQPSVVYIQNKGWPHKTWIFFFNLLRDRHWQDTMRAQLCLLQGHLVLFMKNSFAFALWWSPSLFQDMKYVFTEPDTVNRLTWLKNTPAGPWFYSIHHGTPGSLVKKRALTAFFRAPYFLIPTHRESVTVSDIALQAVRRALGLDCEGRKSSNGIYDVPPCVDMVPGAIRGKVDCPDAFPLGASIWKVNTEAYVKIMTQFTMYNVEQKCN